jgi:PAS domain S-box-containing protein
MNSSRRNNFFTMHPNIVGLLVFLIVSLITQSIAFQRYLINSSEIEKENIEEINRFVDQIQFNLNYALSATNTLAVIVENYGMPVEFDSIAKKLISANELIDGIQLLEKGIITKMYPLEGNEMVIGYDVVADPARGKEVLMAAEKGQMYFGGPFELRQGGMGVVGRTPINLDNDSLAFAAVVIRLENLLQVGGIAENNDRFYYQLSKINPETKEKEYFLDTDFDIEKSQVASIIVPLGEWQIYVKEKGSDYYSGVLPLSLMGLFLSFLGAFLTVYLLKRPAELEKQVKLQTELIFRKEKRFRALVEKSSDVFNILDADGKPIYVSPAITTVLGYTETEAYRRNFLNLVHPEDLHVAQKSMLKVLDSPGIPLKAEPFRSLHKDGSWRWIESTATNYLDDPDIKGIVTNFRDITANKLAEDAILGEKELSDAIINSLPGIFYLFNSKGEFKVWNKNLEDVSGYTAEEIKNLSPLDFIVPEDRDYVSERIGQVFEKGESDAETYFYTKNKEKIFYYFTGRSIFYENEICSLGTGIDLSQRHAAELELKRSEEQLLSIFNNSISAVIMMNSEGLITSWNPRAEEIFGWSADEVLRKPMHQFIMPDEHLEKHIKGMKRYKITGEGPIINSNIEITAKRKDKAIIDISLGVTTVTMRGEEFFIGFINDITERKQIERVQGFEQRNRDALINSTKDIIWSVSNDFTLIAANDAFKDSFKKYTGVNQVLRGDNLLPSILDKDYIAYWKSLYERAFAGETFTNLNVVPENETQQELIMETNFNPIVIEGNIKGVACSARNITERIKSQEAIKEYNEKLKTAQEIANLGYWEHTLDSNELYWSDQVFEIWEEDKSTYKPTVENFFDSVVAEDREKFDLYNNKSIVDLEFKDFEYRIKTKSGKTKWIYQKGKRIINAKDGSLVFKGTLRDITERKLQQERILDYIKKLQTAQKIAKLGYWEFDYKNDSLTWSDQVYEIWEQPKKSFKVSYDNFFNTIHPDDRERFSIEQEKGLSGEKPLEVEHRIVLDNGKVKWVLERGKLVKSEDGEPLLFEGTVQDITAQKQIELELREQNQFIKSAIDNLPVGIAVRNIDTGKFTLMNKNFTEIYGWSQSEFKDVETFFKKVYPDAAYREKIRTQIFSDIASKDIKRMQWEGIQVITKKGEKRIVNAKNIPLYDQNLMISTVLDVTEKTLAEQELALSNERYEYVTKATFDAIWDWDLTKQSIFWGEGFKIIFGHKSEHTDIQSWYKKIHPDDLHRIEESIEESLKDPTVLNWENEYRFEHANGTYRQVKDRGVILRNIEREAIRFIGAMQDITSQKEYEQKLIDLNKKLRNLSAHLQEAREEERIVIAREIHDELGQQLTGIKLDVSWIKNKISTNSIEDIERSERLISNINKTINDVRKIASNLRPGILDDLGLEAAIEWQSRQFQEKTGIKCHLKLHNVDKNFGKEINTAVYRVYQEALTNIMRHAKATEVQTHFFVENDTLILDVLDNGIGIGDQEKNNVFSLGITGMRERILKLNGDFLIQNQPKGGTRLKILVPLTD